MNRRTTNADLGSSGGRSPAGGNDRGRGNRSMTLTQSSVEFDACVDVSKKSDECSKFEPNKLLVKGLCEKTTADDLLTFVKAIIKYEVQETVMLKGGKALITLKELTGKQISEVHDFVAASEIHVYYADSNDSFSKLPFEGISYFG